MAYGTTSGSLGSTATGAAGTSHSVTLSGLTPNTRYYYRVTSADAAGNSSTSPATSSAPAAYVPQVQPFVRTTVADFSSGTGAYVADDSGGEVIATPLEGYELSGSSLPAGLPRTVLATGGTATVANGAVTLNGAQVASTTARTTASAIVKATLRPGQSIGLARSDGMTGIRAAFVVAANGSLTAVVSPAGLSVQTIAITGTWTDAPHTFEVRRTSGSTVAFVVDGTQRASAAFATTTTLRPMAVDPTVDANALVIDWFRVGRYATSSTYTSGVVDAGAAVAWSTLTRDVVAPSGTGVTISVRSGSTATPGTGWTGWSTVSATTGSITRTARYLQYQIVSTASSDRFTTPQTRSVTLAFAVP